MESKLKIPASLRQDIHAKFVAANYKSGVFIFKTIDDSTIDLVLTSFIEWAEGNRVLVGDQLDLSILFKK